jgi:ABC-type branched-subunit amino acid transport system ATPase component
MHEGKTLCEGSMEEVQNNEACAGSLSGAQHRTNGALSTQLMLQVENIESGYGGSTVLRRVNLRVEPGQVVCLMGPERRRQNDAA